MLRRVAYWVAVLIISVALVVALIMFFESRDQSRLDSSAAFAAPVSLTLRL